MDRDKANLVRQTTQTEGWRILKARWQEHCEHNKTALRNLLRKATTEDLVTLARLQERLDSIDFVLREAEKLSEYDKQPPDPIY